jgi:RNA polymerase sigma factor (sigma-70 family)
MISVAINEAIQVYRRERSRPLCQPLRDLDAFASHSESPYQVLARVEVTQVVRNAIGGLPAKYRQVLILSDIEQLGIRETAQSLQASVPAVKTRLFRARLMLLAALQNSRTRVSRWSSLSEHEFSRIPTIQQKSAQVRFGCAV